MKDTNKKILIDLIPLQKGKTAKYHGGGECLKSILFTILKNDMKNKIVFLVSKFLIIPEEIQNLIKEYKIFYLEDGIENIVKENNIRKLYISIIGNYKKVKFPKDLELVVSIFDVRTFEIVYDNTMFFYKLNLQHFLYGIVYRICSNNYYLEKMIKNLRKKLYMNKFKNIYNHKNKEVITLSNHSKNSLNLNFFNYLNSKKIKVLYPPAKYKEELISNKKTKIISELNNKEYYLIISSDRLEKNAFRALKALDNLISKRLINRKVVFLGKVKKNMLVELNNKENFLNFDYVESDVLELLYKNCYAFIYPTISEGFGYPPIEVMKYSKPVIASAVTSIIEILGESSIYFNPYSIDEIENRIIQLESEYELRKKLAYRQYLKINQKQEEDLEIWCNEILK